LIIQTTERVSLAQLRRSEIRYTGFKLQIIFVQMDICKNTELPRKDRKFCLGSSIAEVFEKMVEVTKTGNRAQTHIISQFWRTTNDQNQTYCTLKLNCVNKQIKSRVDYPKTDQKFPIQMITDLIQLQMQNFSSEYLTTKTTIELQTKITIQK